ncbi:MAG: enoyl-CoA hydratase/isomerase family protein [Hyphomicrobiales bacterium]|nr:enoyl-CoA hydratase/isomerase family protein [Hyphomicrobiales bacterium]MCY4049648.1 enoyl-CoA hydratase/isomerase family protein [Hyphomicrobiales bacterium]MCY4052766.1 enoyl-CoA hydratase/isomerase family protein [Hyphomicrobiales bacterium]
MTSSSCILLEVKRGVAHLRLNRPEKLNAINAEMVEELLIRCREIERSTARVVILSGEGKAFCAGGDIEAWSAAGAEAFGRHWVRDGHAVFDALARLRQPVIAVLDGHAFGGGLELAACADIRIAESRVRIGQPEAGIGIIPGWSGTQRAVRRFGAQVIRRMAIFGEVFSAEEALALGLVDCVVPDGEGRRAAEEAAERVLGRGSRATELTKMMINASEGEEFERIIESLGGSLAAGSQELGEGIAAFREKRPPNFGKENLEGEKR